MRERGVTVVTATTNAAAPFGSFVASRGLVPIHIGPARRLPFFDGTLDVVHAAGELMAGWTAPGDDVALEFALFDVYRVLRPGGLFWLDHFVFPGVQQLNGTYAPMLDRVGFKRLRWNAGRKVDGGKEKNEWYLSALLEKPMT
jgi:SAM-dependent methyltransferase